jgi:ferritin-like metal-binding protein YciE
MIETANDLFEEEIRDVYDAEKQLVKALPKMAKAASSEDLRRGFEEHLEQTKGHVQRLEQVFQSIDAKPRGKTCQGMKGLVEEGQQAIEENDKGEMRDVLIIGAAKRVEHYEMAAYQSLIMIAESMQNDTAVELLRETLSEEEETDQKLGGMCEELLSSVSSSEDESEDVGEEEARPARSSGKVKTGRAT